MDVRDSFLSVFMSPDMLWLIQSYQPGIPYSLLSIVWSVRTLNRMLCPSPQKRAEAERIRQKWFELHGINGLRHLYRYCRDVVADGSFLSYATSIGDVESIKFLLTHHKTNHESAILQAIQHGDVATLEIFQRVEDPKSDGFTSYGLNLAASCDHLAVVEFLHNHSDTACTTIAMDNAAKNGHIDIVKYLHSHCKAGCTTDALDSAAENGHLEIVKFLHENRSEGCTKKAMDNAAARGHLEVVRYLHEYRTEGCHTMAMDAAASHGNLSIVEFLHWNRDEGCSVEALRGAASGGHLSVVKFLLNYRDEGCLKLAIADAADAGQLEVVKLIIQSKSTCKKTHECPIEYSKVSILRIGMILSRSSGHSSIYEHLKRQQKFRDYQGAIGQKLKMIWNQGFNPRYRRQREFAISYLSRKPSK